LNFPIEGKKEFFRQGKNILLHQTVNIWRAELLKYLLPALMERLPLNLWKEVMEHQATGEP